MALEDKELATLQVDSDQAPLRMVKGQRSYNGLQVIAGQIEEECNMALKWPQCMETYKMMCKDATIAPALNLMEMDIAKVEWTVRVPEGYEEQLKEKADFVRSIMDDMEHTWNDFIRQAATFNRYGFAPIEKVYRKRIRANGSRHSDGLYGLRSLPLIAQDSVASWKWDATGRSVTGIKQWVNIPTGEGDVQTFTREKVDIARNKFLLFRADPQKNSPIGTSPLNSIYVAWRFKTELERHESTGVAQDLRGLKVISIPPRYLSENASEDEKKTCEVFREILRGLHTGEQSGVLLPQAFDENNNPLFDFKVISVMGTATHNIHEIIGRYRKELITGILTPQLILGQDGSGSFALSESLEGVTSTVVTARLKEIRDQLNHDLLPQLFAVNGWDTAVMPYFEFADTQETSLDELSKYIQRVGAIGGLKLDAEAINWLHEQAGLPVAFDDVNISMEEVREQSTAPTSNSGEGMETGTTGNGTARSASRRDTSTSNSEN